MDRATIRNVIQKLEQDVQNAKRVADALEVKKQAEREKMVKAEAELTKMKKPLDDVSNKLQESETTKALLESKVSDMVLHVERMKSEFETSNQRLDEIYDNLDLLKEKEDALTAVQKKKDEKLLENERHLRQMEIDLTEANKKAAKSEKKLNDKIEDKNSLEKVLKVNRLRSRAMQDELLEKDSQIKTMEKLLGAESDKVKGLEDQIQALKQEVVEARDEQIKVEESHSMLLRAQDELRTDTLFNKYF